MGLGTRRIATLVATAGLVFSACSSAATTAPSVAPAASAAPSAAAPSAEPSMAPSAAPSVEPSVAPSVAGPLTFKLADGSTFTLAQRIADKVANKQPLNIYASFEAIAEPGAPYLIQAGMDNAAKSISAKYGVSVTTKMIGTPESNVPAQVSQVQQVVSAGQVDCLGIEMSDPGAFVKVINDSLAAGTPVMNYNGDSPKSNRIAFYGVDDTDLTNELNTGILAGKFTVDWAKKNNVDLTKAALITGDTTGPWAQGRMQGWLQTVKAAFPNMQVVGTPTDAFTTGYDPAQITPKMISFMNGHPDVQFYFSSDWEAAEIGQLIGKNNLKGKVYALGFNVDQTILDDLKDGTIIGTVDQRFDLQAQTMAEGCADLLLGGKVPTPFQYIPATIWTPETVQDAIKLYQSLHAL